MGVDTKSMREIVDATPGDRMALGKQHLHAGEHRFSLAMLENMERTA